MKKWINVNWSNGLINELLTEIGLNVPRSDWSASWRWRQSPGRWLGPWNRKWSAKSRGSGRPVRWRCALDWRAACADCCGARRCRCAGTSTTAAPPAPRSTAPNRPRRASSTPVPTRWRPSTDAPRCRSSSAPGRSCSLTESCPNSSAKVRKISLFQWKFIRISNWKKLNNWKKNWKIWKIEKKLKKLKNWKLKKLIKLKKN